MSCEDYDEALDQAYEEQICQWQDEWDRYLLGTRKVLIESEHWQEWWTWLIETAQKELAPSSFAEWRKHAAILLDSFDTDSVKSREDFEVDRSTFCVRWRGKTCELGNTQQFLLMQHLSQSRNRFVEYKPLALAIGLLEDDKIFHIKARLAKALQSAGMPDLSRCIKTQRGHYGLIFKS